MNTMTGNLHKTKTLVLTSLLFAIALVLAVVENSLPPLPFAVPGAQWNIFSPAVSFIFGILTPLSSPKAGFTDL
jgi:uncharacterized membrane protein